MINAVIGIGVALGILALCYVLIKAVEGDLHMPHLWRKRKQAKYRANRSWIDVKRDVPHKCSKPLNVQAFNEANGYGYNKGDVIECKTCGQRWRCTSLGLFDRKMYPYSAAHDNEYEWVKVSENEDVFQ